MTLGLRWRILALLAVFAAAAPAAAVETPSSTAAKVATPPPPYALPDGYPEGWYAKIDTSLGTIVARLLPQQAPQSVAHFAAFADGRMTWTDIMTGQKVKRPYYDGLEIHRVVPAERFEAGDPTGTGRGAPLVYVPIEVNGPIDFSRPYRIGLTRSSGAKVNGAMFFVTATSQPYLTQRHPCIAEVVIGSAVVDAICAVKIDGSNKPVEALTIERVRLLKVGNPVPLPEPVPFTPVTPKLEALPRK